MFIRLKNTPLSKKTAVQLVENRRVDGRVKQNVVRHFGYAENDSEIEALKQIAVVYMAELENRTQPSLLSDDTIIERINKSLEEKEQDKDKPLDVNLRNIREEKRISVGIQQIYGHIFDSLNFIKAIDKPYNKKSAVRLMKNVVLSRIFQPMSKLSTLDMLSSRFDLKSHITSIYRMMDLLDDKAIEKIRNISYRTTRELLGNKIDVIFYDCTTLYFESFTEDELKQNGYSKDCKFNQSQILLAMLVSKEGLPVGYEIFPGSTFEGHTLENAINTIKNKYDLDKVIFVADSALLSKSNIEYLLSLKHPFIMGARIKNMNKALTEQILDRSNYSPLYNSDTRSDRDNDDGTTYREMIIEKSDDHVLRLITTHSPARDYKDKKDREKAIEKARKKLEKYKSLKSYINNSGYKKYLEIDSNSEITLNEEKISESERWDGLHGIITNVAFDSARNLLSHYRSLWHIEETFRISKHDLKMRPVFHWNPRRIKAHIALCYMALVCTKTLEYKVEYQYKKMSTGAIRKSLSELEMSILKDKRTNKVYALPAQASGEAKKIYDVLGLKWQETPFEIE